MTYAAGRAHIRARKGENTLPRKKNQNDQLSWSFAHAALLHIPSQAQRA